MSACLCACVGVTKRPVVSQGRSRGSVSLMRHESRERGIQAASGVHAERPANDVLLLQCQQQLPHRAFMNVSAPAAKTLRHLHTHTCTHSPGYTCELRNVFVLQTLDRHAEVGTQKGKGNHAERKWKVGHEEEEKRSPLI